MTFFTDSDEARRYARSRPYFHPLAISRAREAMGIQGTVPLGVDIACGTGQSAAALSAIAERVVAFDISWNMLQSARRDGRVRYLQARAEALPFPGGTVPIMSCSLAFHWFERTKFLDQAWRVLSPEGLLLIYNNGFRSIMRENSAFQAWSQETYPDRFPTPPRDGRPFTSEEAEGAGFIFIKEESYENDVTFTPEELVAYLTTQTNVAAAVRDGRESLEGASGWLLDQVRPYFAGASGTFVFVTRAWYLRKTARR